MATSLWIPHCETYVLFSSRVREFRSGERSAAPRYERSLRRSNIFAAVAEHPRHPNQFIKKFFRPSDETFIEQLPVFGKNFAGICKINVPEDSNEPELAHHRQQRLDHARAAKNASRHAANTNGFVNVFFEVH